MLAAKAGLPFLLLKSRFTQGRVFFACCGVVISAWAITIVLLWPSHGTLLDWDEVDYVKAAKLGLLVNAFEVGSLNPSEYIRFGFSKLRKGEPVIPVDYDESEDPTALRHFHPPFVIYVLSAFSASPHERVLRLVQLIGALAFLVALQGAYYSVRGVVTWAGSLLVMLLGVWMCQTLFRSVSMHGWEAVWITAAAVFLGSGLSGGQSARSYKFLCAILALAFLTLETGLLVWVGAVLCVGLWQNSSAVEPRSKFLWRQIGYGLSLTITLAVIAWPGVVIKLSFLKLAARHLYAIRLGEEMAGFSNVIPGLVRLLLPMLILGTMAGLWLFFSQREGIKRWGPFALLAVVYGVAMTRVSMRPHYLLPAVAPLACLVGVAFDSLPPRAGKWVAGLSSVVVVVMLWPVNPAVALDAKAREDLHWLTSTLRGRESYIDGGHIYQYYFGDGYAIKLLTVYPDRLTTREKGAYRSLGSGEVKGNIVVIQMGRPGFRGGAVEKTLLRRCARTERATVIVYDCAEGIQDTRELATRGVILSQ